MRKLLIIICCLFLWGCDDPNKVYICIEKKDIYNSYPIISEDIDSYKIEVPYDTIMELPKNGKWVQHPYTKGVKSGSIWYRYRRK